MISSTPSYRTAWRFLGVWGGLAIIASGIAIFLTLRVTYVNRAERNFQTSAFQAVGVFVELAKLGEPENDEKPTLPTSVIYKQDEGLETATIKVSFSFRYPVIIFLNNVAGPDACEYETFLRVKNGAISGSERVELTRADVEGFGRSEDADFYKRLGINAYSAVLAPSIVPPAHLTCKLNSTVRRETYTRRSVHFINVRDSTSFYTYATDSKRWRLDMSEMQDVENISFAGSAGELGDSADDNRQLELGATRELAPGDNVAAGWDSLFRESWRDIDLVIIGALIALAATWFVEAVRPFVEIGVGGDDQEEPRKDELVANGSTSLKITQEDSTTQT